MAIKVPIIIDFSPVMVASAMYDASHSDNGSIEGKFLMNEDQMRSMALNTIRLHVRRFKTEFGPEIVIAYDAETYWRSEVFPYYKKNRSKQRDSSKFDWVGYKAIMLKLKKEFQQVLPYKNIEVERAEADDIIATLVKTHQTRYAILRQVPPPLVIVSGDKDFLQLQLGNSNIKQWAPMKKEFITYEDYEYRDLNDHIIRGDSSDGIPNILSDSDTFVTEGKSQTKMTAKNYEFARSLQNSPNYARNRQLIDFEAIPDDIRNDIIVAYDAANEQNRMKLLNYLISTKTSGMMDVLGDF
jgi:hypothetical protein